MKVALSLLVIAMVASCGQSSASSPQVQASPTPERFGTATLSETACSFEMPDNLPLHEVSFSLVTRTRYTGHFGLIRIDNEHTYRELVDFWYGHNGLVAPSFSALVAETAVPPNSSGQLVATVSLKATYAFHCGYNDDSGKVTGFFHELRAG